VACRVLNVSRSGYYEWLSRLDSPRRQENELLLKQIRQIHDESRGTYGSPRVHAELTLGLGLPVNLKRVARLMREAGIQGLYRCRRRGCTVRDPDAQPAADLVNRQFGVDEPNRLWITDITEHPTMEGKVYCAAVMDAYSRLIVGWSIAEHMRTELVTDALGMAIIRRQPQKSAADVRTILHSDHGSNILPELSVRAAPTEGGPARLDGHRRGLLRQCDDGVVLGHDAARAARLENVANPGGACQRHLRVDRMLVQPEPAPFQHWNAQPHHLRDPPHRARPRSLTPHRRCPAFGLGSAAPWR
jgi:HTH-like domain/Integrase core domain